MSGLNIDEKNPNKLRFADDILLITNDLDESEVMLNEFSPAIKEVGLQMNETKTNFLTNFVVWEIFKLENSTIEEILQYKYLIRIY